MRGLVIFRKRKNLIKQHGYKIKFIIGYEAFKLIICLIIMLKIFIKLKLILIILHKRQLVKIY